jgi:hypothetical protein
MGQADGAAAAPAPVGKDSQARVIERRRLAMRMFWTWVVVLVVPTIWVATARTQETSLPEGTTVKLLLLRQKSVQKELEITPDLAKKIMAFTNAQSDAAGKVIKLDQAERKKGFEKLEEQNKQFLANSLSAKQNERLNQIALQFTALEQLTNPKTAKVLNLTEEQQQKLKDLQTKSRKELADLIGAKDAAGRNEKFAQLREKTRTSILALLTEKQQAQVREMAGPPFTGEIVFDEDDSGKEK